MLNSKTILVLAKNGLIGDISNFTIYGDSMLRVYNTFILLYSMKVRNIIIKV